ncbi:MAG: hypothetical protein AAB446_02340 [Patescibacteria group bacterium]
MEGLENIKNEEKTLLESKDQEVADRLGSLGIKFDYSINNDGKLIYNFYNVKQLGNAAFSLETDNKTTIYQALHFGGENFEEPGSKKEITPDELIQYLSEKFPEASNIIFSCCYPDKARTLLNKMGDKIIFIGTGSDTYSTWYNSKENKLSSVRNTKSEQI